MEVRKIAVGSLMIGAIGAAGLGLAGTASADYKKPTVTYSWQSNTTKKVVVANNGQVGNGNTTQSASGAAGAISNPQLALGVNVGAQVPIQVSPNVVTSRTGGAEQNTRLSQSAGSNYSNNSTSVNTSAENGNFSSVKIGS